MTMVIQTIGAGEFKARCLALLDEVAREHKVIIVTKRGKAVAKVSAAEPISGDIRKQLKASVVRETDLVSPLESSWESGS